MSEVDFVSLLGRKLYSEEAVRCISDLGVTPEINDEGDKTFCEFYPLGLAFVANTDADIESIQFYTEESGFASFSGELPSRLSFSMDAVGVRGLLGEPSRSGGGERDPSLGDVVPVWIRYDTAHHSIHIEFGRDDRGRDRITMVTLMSAARVATLGS